MENRSPRYQVEESFGTTTEPLTTSDLVRMSKVLSRGYPDVWFSFSCPNCDGGVVEGTGPLREGGGRVRGVPCDSCDATFTVEYGVPGA